MILLLLLILGTESQFDWWSVGRGMAAKSKLLCLPDCIFSFRMLLMSQYNNGGYPHSNPGKETEAEPMPQDTKDDAVDRAAELFADLFLRQCEYRRRKKHKGSKSDRHQ